MATKLEGEPMTHAVAAFRVVDRYDTGLPRTYEAAGLTFAWDDWVLCEIAWGPGNVVHWCLASAFRGEDEKHVTCTVLNPSYVRLNDLLPLRKLAHFRPVEVLERVRIAPTGEDDHQQLPGRI